MRESLNHATKRTDQAHYQDIESVRFSSKLQHQKNRGFTPWPEYGAGTAPA
ncbi:hypothetical protein SAMN04488101_12229 [Pedobacter nyackensis]|uniref:Uncharacterized protein n=1 Tax=Pedobacter nyackensis TaxID=475255 RepID=A0A1W2F5L7_9SPHI|nr:hypothetical protein SAMN04488101_12229 [Pedobacter nyackensis]